MISVERRDESFDAESFTKRTKFANNHGLDDEKGVLQANASLSR